MSELKFKELVGNGVYDVDEKMSGFLIECIKNAGYVVGDSKESKTHIGLKQEVSKTGKVLSGYQKFVKAKSGKGVTMTEIAKEWKALSEAEKATWKGEEVVSGGSVSPVKSGKAKRGQSTWNKFVTAQIKVLKAECDKESKKFNLPEAMKKIGPSWKKMTKEEQKNYGASEVVAV